MVLSRLTCAFKLAVAPGILHSVMNSVLVFKDVRREVAQLQNITGLGFLEPVGKVISLPGLEHVTELGIVTVQGLSFRAQLKKSFDENLLFVFSLLCSLKQPIPQLTELDTSTETEQLFLNRSCVTNSRGQNTVRTDRSERLEPALASANQNTAVGMNGLALNNITANRHHCQSALMLRTSANY